MAGLKIAIFRDRKEKLLKINFLIILIIQYSIIYKYIYERFDIPIARIVENTN